MIDKKFSLILFIVGMSVLAGCAGRRSLVSQRDTTKKEPDRRAINHFVDGILLDLDQKYAAALLSYQEALLYDSSASTIYLAIARDYIRLGKEESAIISLRKCLELDPYNIEAMDLLSRIYMAQRKWTLAERTFRRILSQDSLRFSAYYSLALLYKQQKAFDKAAEMYQRMLELQFVPDPQILIELGELYIDTGRFEDARGIFQKLIDADPVEGYGYLGLGIVNEALGDTTEAVENYKKAISLDPRLPAREQLSRIHILREQWDEAIRVCQEAVQYDSTDLVSWLTIGEIYHQQGDTVAAIQTYQKINTRFPEEWRAHLNLGRIYQDQQHYDKAFDEFKTITQLSPETFLGWLFSGVTLIQMESMEASLPFLRKALELVPEDPLGNYYLGSALAELDRSQEAIPYLEKALQAQPDGVLYLSALANAYENLDEFTKADSLYQEALKLDPENALVLNNYGYSLSERGIRLEEAMIMAQKALQKEPKNGAYLDTMGWIYYQMGQYEEALKYIEEAHNVRESAEVAKHLGDVYDKLGMKDKARDAWKKALELDEDNLEILRRLREDVEE